MRITCRRCNGFVTCKVRSGELIYIAFLHSLFCTLGLYPEDIDQDFFTFSVLPEKMQRIYQKFLKEGNGNLNF